MFIFKVVQIVFILLCFSSTAIASSKSFFYERFLNKNIKSAKSINTKELFFDQKINHYDDKDLRTYKQRYFISHKYARSNNAPVFLYICGESTCKAGRIESGSTVAHAKKFGAVLIALEHRYYGVSMPFKTLATKNLKYLSTEQALYDIENFQTSLSKKLGLRKEWIVFGGSYPGSLAAYYRLKFPFLAIGALASSAPVRADANYDEYDEHVSLVVGEKCGARMKEAVSIIEASYDNPKEWAKYLKMFGSQDVKHKVDFLYVIADVGAIAAQYGYVKRFCDDLMSAKSAVDGYAKFTAYITKAWGMKPSELAVEWAKNIDPKAYVGSFGMRQWYYQSCTEYGYWQNAHPTRSVRSQRINSDYHNEICDRLFGIKKPVDITRINNNFYYPLLNPAYASNIYFTNGNTDPWSKLSIDKDIVSKYNPNLMSFLIDGAAHCDDLRSKRREDSKPLSYSRLLMERNITKWLK